MLWLFDALRRVTTAALVIVLIACAAEVALRWERFQTAQASRVSAVSNLPVLPSRETGSELASAWYGTAVHAETGQPLPLRVNSLGLRGPELPRDKPAGTLRILCLGDDTTLAAGHSEAEAYPGQLAIALARVATTPVEILHAGLPGGCPLTEVIYYRRLLRGLRPDVVIVHVDLSDAREDALARGHLRVDDAGEPVAVVHPSLEVAAGPLESASQEFALVEWLGARLGARVAGAAADSQLETFQQQLLAWDQSTAATPNELPRVLKPLLQLHAWLEADGATLVVCTCPNAWQAAELVRGQYGGGNALLTAPADALQQLARERGFVCVDATAAIARHPEPGRLYLPHGHGLSAVGHTLYAEELARTLSGGYRAERAAQLPHATR